LLIRIKIALKNKQKQPGELRIITKFARGEKDTQKKQRESRSIMLILKLDKHFRYGYTHSEAGKMIYK
jgi:hypothetical protein